MAKHHGMNDLEGIDAFCHYSHEAEDEDRFGRLFGGLPPLNTRSKELEALGAQDGPMDGGEDFDRTDTVSAGQIFFGQFIDHDITLDTTTSLASVADESEVPNVRTPTLDLDNIYGMGPEATPFLYRPSGPLYVSCVPLEHPTKTPRSANSKAGAKADVRMEGPLR